MVFLLGDPGRDHLYNEVPSHQVVRVLLLSSACLEWVLRMGLVEISQKLCLMDVGQLCIIFWGTTWDSSLNTA